MFPLHLLGFSATPPTSHPENPYPRQEQTTEETPTEKGKRKMALAMAAGRLSSSVDKPIKRGVLLLFLDFSQSFSALPFQVGHPSHGYHILPSCSIMFPEKPLIQAMNRQMQHDLFRKLEEIANILLQTDTKKISAGSIFFETMPYRLNESTGYNDYDQVQKTAVLFRSILIVTGARAYARLYDYVRIRKVRGAILLADMAHISRLVEAGVIPSAFECRCGDNYNPEATPGPHMKVLESVHVAANNNTVPGDISAMVPGGNRMGTLALTSRGFVEEDFAEVAEFFDAATKLAVKNRSLHQGTRKSTQSSFSQSGSRRNYEVSKLKIILHPRTRSTHESTPAVRSLSVSASSKTAEMADVESNPLLKEFYFPPFDSIEAKNVRPGIRALLKQLESDLEELERTVEPTWPKLVEPLEKIVDRLAVVWGAVSHLKAVKDNADLRSAIEEVQPEKVAFELKLGQSKPIYNAFKSIRESSDWEGLTDARKRIVDAQIKEAFLNGIALEDDKREEFNKIEQELAKLSQKFGENVLDATKKFEKLITDKKDIEGLPETALGLGAQTAVSKGHENATAENGPWIITLDAPSFMAVMQHAKNRTLREEVYRAYISRASSGDLDNTAIIDQILKLRLEKAKLLGYNNYAEVSMATKMATVEKAEELLEKLRSASWNPAVQDMEDLKIFSKNQGAPEADTLNHWDISFWRETPRIKEELRPYFSLPKVMDGLFSLANKLFGINIEPADGLAPVWNSDVRFYRVNDSSGTPIAYFYFDPYSRPSEKRGGAWMDEVASRSRVLSKESSSPRLPVAHMVCNQMPPVGDKPSLMTFREVETVFHEFGHALQHMLTRQDEGLVAGIRNVEWDAVELPSQFMENWCYHRDTLMSIGKHYETGESIPDDVYKKLLAARTFRAGSLSLRQLRFATLDLELHTKYIPGGSESIYDVDRRVCEKTQVLPPLPEDKFLCGFSHIFAGGYAAGYYSYKWAEVLSADAFSAFEDAGLNNEKAVKETGNRFRETVLALGGGKAPLEVFVAFRGREPSPEALLRHNGLLQVA
ncbi:Organellar oligopeptidase A, chloroplastic/mitochondrial [Sesamum angolense]|uniref:oligopeptidase A n=1 Tax=Sesamum angolense TaxID=2727404 RepID=A0AAE1WHM6_9LAMI|nr:Organellar oligopeptidase A, chloroplastic/mitochondrial [Sesamum angolense]